MMKKIILSLAVVIASMGSLTAIAQTPDNASTPVAQQSVDANRGDRMPAKKDKKNKKNKKNKKKGCCQNQQCQKDKKGKKGNRMNNPAQARLRPEGERKGFKPLTGIQLTPAQQTKVGDLQQSTSQKREKLRDETRKKQLKIDEQYNKELQKILTPEQYAQYQSDNSAKQSRPQEGRKPKREGRKQNCCQQDSVTVCPGSIDGQGRVPQPRPLTEVPQE